MKDLKVQFAVLPLFALMTLLLALPLFAQSGPAAARRDVHHDVSMQPGELSSLSFAITGDTRPPNEDDTEGYPTAIITKIFQDMQAASPRPAFAVATGNYMFSDPDVDGTQSAQLDDYLTASSNFSNMVYPAMGSHECDGATADNCSTTLSGNTYDYIAFYDQMLEPIGLQLPYYTVNFAGPNNAWTAKFVFVACNAWSTQQATWLSTSLSAPTTYTFAIWNELLTDTSAPCLSGTGSNNAYTILNQYPYSLLITGDLGTYEYISSDKEVVVGLGGAPLAGTINYGYVIAQQQSNGQIVFSEYDYETNAENYTFTIGAVLAANTVTFTTPAPSSAEYGSSFTVAASGLGTGAMTYTSGGSCSNSGATYTVTSGTGSCTVTATQTADSTYASGNASESVTAEPAGSSVSVSLTSGTNPSNYGQSLTFTASITSSAGAVKGRKTRRPRELSGSVAWSANTGCGTTPVTTGYPGVATCTTSGLPAGTDTITATYSGDSNHGESTGTLSQVVNGETTITLTPASLAFGDVVEDATSAAKSVTLKNTGTAALSITNIAVSGDFALATGTSCGSALAAGKTCVIKVTFTPMALGAFSGSITITDNASGNPQTVPMTGTGIVAATLTPATAAYTSQTVGTTSAAKVFTLANKQSVALTSIAISTTGDFTVSTTTCGTSLAAKKSCKISLVFRPTATGVTTGTLQAEDSATGSPQTSNLKGTGKQ
jgi:hypothetical protein